ncbi:Uncharacterized protein HZ326_26735 [Fusarium oxysporum f. sp. albedinis]|nr:Uncharacterized protein HZ326_26735 [Fusarium oxysporum f. sp. albedinis]
MDYTTTHRTEYYEEKRYKRNYQSEAYWKVVIYPRKRAVQQESDDGGKSWQEGEVLFPIELSSNEHLPKNYGDHEHQCPSLGPRDSSYSHQFDNLKASAKDQHPADTVRHMRIFSVVNA